MRTLLRTHFLGYYMRREVNLQSIFITKKMKKKVTFLIMCSLLSINTFEQLGAVILYDRDPKHNGV